MNTRPKHRHVVILCHPDTDSFNAAVAAHYCQAVEDNGQSAVLRDLYRMKFDPVLRSEELADDRKSPPGQNPSRDVAEEHALIADADVVVLVYPIWLGSVPAMLKGYIDRVFGHDFALRNDHDAAAVTELSGKHMLSLSSSGNSRTWLDEQGQWQSLIQVFDRYLQQAFAIASIDHVHFPSIVAGLSERFFEQNMEDVRQAARKACERVSEMT
jgi:NAD(P)H dehydrogenase (quinone)